MIRAHKIELRPDAVQEVYFQRCAGTMRFVYNSLVAKVKAGVDLVVADRFYASSKTCSTCGHKVDGITLAQRTFRCHKCNVSIDRDLNAAINLNNLTPPIQGSQKPRTIGLRKTSEAELLDDANNVLVL